MTWTARRGRRPRPCCSINIKCDAVITDLHLTVHRKGDGMRIAWDARRRNPEACIVMLTGYVNDTTEEEARGAAASTCFGRSSVELAHLSAFVDLALNGDKSGARAWKRIRKWRHH